MAKAIILSNETHQQVFLLKAQLQAKDANEVIQELLQQYKQE